MKAKDLTGMVFGRLTALRIEKTGRQTKWLCRCECGNEHIVQSHHLTGGATKSCGCLNSEMSSRRSAKLMTRHGLYGTPAYASWKSMIERCTNPNHVNNKYYAGRGITVCARWLNSFADFHADMGDRPPGTSLDRIDVNGNYEPGNCRWATPKEQANNKRKGEVAP